MSTMVYEWGSRHHAVPAQVVGEAIAAIQQRDGTCRPDALVAAARDEANELHPLFTWDDDEAARRWRRQEARQVINSLRVTLVGYAEPVPAFVSVTWSPAGREPIDGYQPITVVRHDAAMRAEAMADALAQLDGLRRRYAAIEALSPVWEAVDAVASTRSPAAVAAD